MPQTADPAVDDAPELETTDCPLCGSPLSEPVRTVHDLWYGIPGTFEIVRCRNCTHCYLSPRPTPASIGTYYPANYGPYHASADGLPAQGDEPSAGEDSSGRPWYLSRPVRAIPGLRRFYYWLTESWSVWVPERPGDGATALELGCSDGVFLERLKKLGWEAVGIEPSVEPAERARRRGLDVRVGTLEPGMFPPASFHACFAWMVVEHLHDPKQTLQEMRRLLKDNGWLVFSVPNYASLERRMFGAYWDCLDPPRHLQHFRPRVLRQLLEELEFVDVRIIHQRNMLSLLQSLGLFLRDRKPDWRIGPSLMHFVEHPTMWPQIALAPIAKLLAWFHLGSRLTVTARAGATSEAAAAGHA